MAEDFLHPGERIVAKYKRSRFFYIHHYITFFLLLMGAMYLVYFLDAIELDNKLKIAIIALPFVYIFICDILRKAHTYFLTDKRVIHKYQFFSKRIASMAYKRITDTKMIQSFMNRILGIGSLEINTGDSEVIELMLHGVKRPQKVLNKIQHLMHAAPVHTLHPKAP